MKRSFQIYIENWLLLSKFLRTWKLHVYAIFYESECTDKLKGSLQTFQQICCMHFYEWSAENSTSSSYSNLEKVENSPTFVTCCKGNLFSLVPSEVQTRRFPFMKRHVTKYTNCLSDWGKGLITSFERISSCYCVHFDSYDLTKSHIDAWGYCIVASL